jgi:hypothetical protein
MLFFSLNFGVRAYQCQCPRRLIIATLNLRGMSQSNLPIQVDQQFDSLATFQLAMIRWAVNLPFPLYIGEHRQVCKKSASFDKSAFL